MRTLFTVLLWVAAAVGGDLQSPAPAGSGQPYLAEAPDGSIRMSWIEPRGEGRHVLRFSVLRKGTGWSPARSAVEGGGWMVNWADFPSILELTDGAMAAHWLVRHPGKRAAYDAWMALSFDSGATWSAGSPLHRDGTATEHGFVSMFPMDGATVGAAWLDGREAPRMTLRAAAFGRDGRPSQEWVLDEDVCTCCPTSVAITSQGPLVAYRDHHPGEIRDISVVGWNGGRWSPPRSVSQDGWKIHGCPVNGPSIAASGRRVALAWYTMADQVPRVRMAFSDDAGQSFHPAVELAGGAPTGRVQVRMLEDASAVASWLERAPENGAEAGRLMARRVWPSGKLGRPVTVAAVSPARSTGFPQMARWGEHLVFCWTTPAGVATAAIPVPAR